MGGKSSEELLGISLWVFISPVIFFIGVFGNILSLFILSGKSFKRGSVSFILSALAIVDTGVLVTSLLRHWILYTLNIDIRNEFSSIGCKTHVFLSYYLSQLSSWTLVLVTVDRAMSVIDPLTVRSNLNNRRKIIIVWLTMALTLFLFNSNFMWTVELEYVNKRSASKNDSYPNTTYKNAHRNHLFQNYNQNGTNIIENYSSLNESTIFYFTDQKYEEGFASSYKNISSNNHQTETNTSALKTDTSNKQLQCYFNAQYAYFTQHIWPWVDFILCVTLPFLIIAICNVVILVCVWKTMKVRKNEQCFIALRKAPPNNPTHHKILHTEENSQKKNRHEHNVLDRESIEYAEDILDSLKKNKKSKLVFKKKYKPPALEYKEFRSADALKMSDRSQLFSPNAITKNKKHKSSASDISEVNEYQHNEDPSGIQYRESGSGSKSNHSTPEFSQSNKSNSIIKNKNSDAIKDNENFDHTLKVCFKNHRSVHCLHKHEKHPTNLPSRLIKVSSKSSPTLAPFTTMLLGLGVCFLFTNAPCGIYFLLEDYYFSGIMDDEQAGSIMLAHAIVNLLNFANYSANFLLYCFTGSKFRMALKGKIRSLKRLFSRHNIFTCRDQTNHRNYA